MYPPKEGFQVRPYEAGRLPSPTLRKDPTKESIKRRGVTVKHDPISMFPELPKGKDDDGPRVPCRHAVSSYVHPP